MWAKVVAVSSLTTPAVTGEQHAARASVEIKRGGAVIDPSSLIH
jgi:hypothetical protein